jgi:glycosyltransferase involved in cell wall biosynthesis
VKTKDGDVKRTDRRTRVLQVIGSMHIGGAENAVVHLARGLDPGRYDVSVCCTSALGVLAEGLISESVNVVLAAPGRRLRYLTPLYLQRTIARLRPDVVHTHGTPALLHAGPLGFAGLLPYWVHTFHYGNYPLPNARQMKGERVFSRAASQLVAVSETQRESIIRHHGIRPDRIITVVNGVGENPHVVGNTTRARKRSELGFGPDEIVAGCVAVLSEQKGISYLLQAARLLGQQNGRIRFLIAGGGPLEASLRQQARDLGLESRVVFTGWRQDNLELLTALDVFVMSSLWEAMPLALLEAMAARLPIVVTDVGDNRAVVDGGSCGIVIPPRNAEAIAEAIGHLVGRPERARELAGRAHSRFLECFTTARMLEEYERVYDDGLAGFRSGRPEASEEKAVSAG